VRRRIKTASLTPEQSGLTGCWRFIAVERTTIDLTKPKAERRPETEIAHYASSHTRDERSDQELLDLIVGHWDAIENGVHRVRDVTFGEDACRVARPNAARNRVTLCNLAIGLYNLELKQSHAKQDPTKPPRRTKGPSLPSWQRSMSASAALKRVMK
jgi:predicted transposase YbfD/YdcC